MFAQLFDRRGQAEELRVFSRICSSRREEALTHFRLPISDCRFFSLSLLTSAATGRNNTHHLWFSGSQRSGLVGQQVRDLFRRFNRFRVSDENARLRAAAHADHDGHGRCQSQRARTGNNQHRHRIDQRVSHRRRRSPNGPDDESDDGNADDGRHEIACHAVRQFLDRRAAALGFRHHLHNLREQRFGSDLLRPHQKSAGLIDGRADDGVVHALGDRHRFAGNHGFVHVAPAFDDHAVNGNFLAGPDAQHVAFRALRPPARPVPGRPGRDARSWPPGRATL